MTKPVINDSQITMSLEWFLEAVKAIDRNSYACGGMLNSKDTDELAVKLLVMDINELKKVSK